MNLEDWDTGEEISLKDMDALIGEMRDARELYEQKKADSSIAYKDYAVLEAKVMQALEAAGKKSYKAEGVGTFSIVEKRVVQTPKTVEQKKKVFDWVKDKFGEEFLVSLTGINHQTLNSFYNKCYSEYLEKLEQAREEGIDTSDMSFDLPLPEPTIQKSTSFRKAR